LPFSRRRDPANNDRNTKHGRGGRAPARDGKRAYDRRSGTGRGKEIKKGGGGARNWGNDKAEAKKMEGKVDEEEVKEDKPAEGESPAEETPVAPEPEPEPKPQDNTMTLAEYMASKEKKDATSDREVENEFQGKTAAKKVEVDFLVLGEGKSKKKKKGKDTKQAVEVGFRVVSQLCVFSVSINCDGVIQPVFSLSGTHRLVL
jgi:plasminogen activator inhibitor 1 RNA-binding protein